jgi:anti-sigma28 factor (negative regulator of flagellin synthesis)
MIAEPDNPGSSGSSSGDEPTIAAKIQVLLDHIRALDKSIDEARMKKIANIEKALADGTYHVSAAEIARKLIDQMREP